MVIIREEGGKGFGNAHALEVGVDELEAAASGGVYVSKKEAESGS